MILLNDPGVISYVELRCETKFQTPHSSVGLVRPSGRLGCGFVLFNYTGANVELMAAAEPGGITRKALKAVCRYVYDGLNCKGMIAVVSETNAQARDVWARCGLKNVAHIPDFFHDGEGVFIMRMTREECRWL